MDTEKNKDIVVSFLYCTSSQALSLHEQRILLRLIEMAQCAITGIKLKDNLGKVEHGLWDKYVSMPISSIFERNMTHRDVISTLDKLSQRYIVIEDEQQWSKISLINSPKYNKYSGQMRFSVDNQLWDAFLDFSKGYRSFEMSRAMQLTSTYAVRLYLLMSGQKTPLYFSIERLKDILGIEPDKYKDTKGKHRIDHLEQRVLKPSQQQLNSTCPYSFTYEKIREVEGYQRSPVIGIRLYPVFLPDNRDTKLEQRKLLAQISLASIPDEALHYLRNFGFTEDEIRRNKPTLLAACEVLDLVELLSHVSGRARQAKNPKGYVVNAIKKAIKENL